MFRNIQDRFKKRLELIKTKTQAQTGLEKTVRSFFIEEFGPIGESLSFNISQENKKINLRLNNKTAANEIVLRSGKLRTTLREHDNNIESININ